jgi:hypothetical protein
MNGLEQKNPGRPETPEHELNEAVLKKRIEELEQEKELLEKQMELKDLVRQIKLDEAVEQQQKARKSKAKKKR